jgi:hypothetical protein
MNYKPKFIQICSNSRSGEDESVFALDENGDVWDYQYGMGGSKWIKLNTDREGCDE